MRFVGFSARRHHENKKHMLFLVFRPKNQKTQWKTKKPKFQPKPKESLPDFVFLFFFLSRVVLLSRKIVGSRFPKQVVVCVSVLIEEHSFSVETPKMCQNTDNSSFLTRKPRKKTRNFQELDRKTASQNCGRVLQNTVFFKIKRRPVVDHGGATIHIYIYIYICACSPPKNYRGVPR